ncbi:MAG TPA: hypothetical protein VK995_05950 [Oceanipulchritudo sp.]|nr:hypothetical protein [Oceanipulchritudo sp.]
MSALPKPILEPITESAPESAPESVPERVPELVEFPNFPPPERKARITAGPSIDNILRRMNPAKSVDNPFNPFSPVSPAVKIETEASSTSLEQEREELREQQREFAAIKAESLERIRVARELETLLAARERLLDDREAMLSSRIVEDLPNQGVFSLQKSLNQTRQALNQASQSLAEKDVLISGLRAEIENLKAARSNSKAGPAGPVDGYEDVTHESLAEQVAFLKEREAFIEESENVLFDKAQHLQEWETRLQQSEHDQVNA